MHQGGHLVGEVVGNKTLVEYVGQNKHKQHLWMVKCNSCDEVAGPMTFSHAGRYGKSCSICQRLPENNGRWKGHELLTGSWLYQYRNDAAKKNREWSVTPEELWSLWLRQDGRCIYTNLELIHGETASLDRIDSSKGYVLENLQWVHRDINRMKSDFDADYFVQLCSLVRTNNESK